MIPSTSTLVRVILVLLTGVVVTTFDVMRVSSDSMRKTLEAGDIIVVDRSAVLLRHLGRRLHPARGQLAVFRVPGDDAQVKRVIAVPGDRVRIDHGTLMVNGSPVPEAYLSRGRGWTESWPAGAANAPTRDVVIAPEHYFCLGDNRGVSYDSRHRGAIPENDFVGIAWFVWRRGT